MRAFPALLALLALASAACLPRALCIDPPSEHGARWVYVQMQLVDISKIDGVEQAFAADFYMLSTWAAPLGDTGMNGSEELTAEVMKANFWYPDLEFINARDKVEPGVDEPFSFVSEPLFDLQKVRPGWTLPPGWVWITEDQRYQGEFTTALDMMQFPFDEQFLEFSIESFWDSSQVKIVWAKPDGIDQLVPDALKDNIIGWDYKGSEVANKTQHYPYNGRDYDRLIVSTRLRRQPQFYLTKIVAGCFLLVYMCIWVFSLAVDEADRMMGTLQIFAGLITFLFVASGDTPKVPYQTRLDLFMLWSFMNVAFMLFIHGTLYYWRECDVEDLLKERDEEKVKAHRQKSITGGGPRSPVAIKAASVMPQPNSAESVEMGIASPSAAAAATAASSPTSVARVYVNEHEVADASSGSAGDAAESHDEPWWRIRYHAWAHWSLSKWFWGLHLTRRWDAICIPGLTIVYTVGAAVILGRTVDTPEHVQMQQP